MRILAALLAIFFNIWALIFGFRDLSTWLQARFGGPYHLADLDWTSSGVLLLGWFAAVVAMSVYPVVKPKASGGRDFGRASLVALPIFIGLVGIIDAPSNTWSRGAAGIASYRVGLNAQRLQANVLSWMHTHDKFPSNDAELQEVFRELDAELQEVRRRMADVPGTYAHQGAPLPYRAVFVGNAKGPVLQPTLPEPGVLYYAINDAGDHFWITASVLDGGSSEKAVILRSGDAPRVLEGQLPEKPKSEEPKPEASKPKSPKRAARPPPEKKP